MDPQPIFCSSGDLCLVRAREGLLQVPHSRGAGILSGWSFITPSALLNWWLLGPVLGTAGRQLNFCWEEGTKQRTGAAHGLEELGREREREGKGGEIKGLLPPSHSPRGWLEQPTVSPHCRGFSAELPAPPGQNEKAMSNICLKCQQKGPARLTAVSCNI